MDSPSPDPSKPPASGSKSGRPDSMDTTASRTPRAATTPIPDEDHGSDLPLTMSASVVLTGLPRDAHEALADVEAIDKGKGMWYFFIFLFFSFALFYQVFMVENFEFLFMFEPGFCRHLSKEYDFYSTK